MNPFRAPCDRKDLGKLGGGGAESKQGYLEAGRKGLGGGFGGIAAFK